MDIKEIREWAKDLSNYHFETRVSDLNDTARLFNNLKAAVPLLLSEVDMLGKENAALREVVEAAKKAWNKFSANGESLPCAGGHFVSGNMTINDMLLIGEAIEKIKGFKTKKRGKFTI